MVGGVLVAILVVVGFAILNYQFLRVATIPENGELYHISQRYDSNNNESYSIIFYGVTFTFDYWTYPWGATDLPFSAHFTIHFDDGVIEELSILIGGFVGVASDAPLLPILSNHSNPQAGVATAHSYDLHGYWILLVSL